MRPDPQRPRGGADLRSRHDNGFGRRLRKVLSWIRLGARSRVPWLAAGGSALLILVLGLILSPLFSLLGAGVAGAVVYGLVRGFHRRSGDRLTDREIRRLLRGQFRRHAARGGGLGASFTCVAAGMLTAFGGGILWLHGAHTAGIATAGAFFVLLLALLSARRSAR